MKNLLIIIFILSLFQANAQANEDRGEFVSDSFFVDYDKDSLNGKFSKYHVLKFKKSTDTNIFLTGEFINGQPNGKWTYWGELSKDSKNYSWCNQYSPIKWVEYLNDTIKVTEYQHRLLTTYYINDSNKVFIKSRMENQWVYTSWNETTCTVSFQNLQMPNLCFRTEDLEFVKVALGHNQIREFEYNTRKLTINCP